MPQPPGSSFFERARRTVDLDRRWIERTPVVGNRHGDHPGIAGETDVNLVRGLAGILERVGDDVGDDLLESEAEGIGGADR